MRVRRPRRQGRRLRRPKDDDWDVASDAELPDWNEMDEDYVAGLQQEVAAQRPKRSDVTAHPIANACHLRPLHSLDKSMRTAVLAKLRKMAPHDAFAQAAVETPNLLHLLLWLPQHRDDDSLARFLTKKDFQQTRLAAAWRDGVGAEAPASPHLLAYCVIDSRHHPALRTFNIVEFFDSLCAGYNTGQLLYRLAGEACLAQDLAAGSSDTRQLGARAASPAQAAGSHPGSTGRSLARWPFPYSPANVFYWAKVESRIPALGCGGLLAAFADLVQRSRDSYPGALQEAQQGGSGAVGSCGRPTGRVAPGAAVRGAVAGGCVGETHASNGGGDGGGDGGGGGGDSGGVCGEPVQWGPAGAGAGALEPGAGAALVFPTSLVGSSEQHLLRLLQDADTLASFRMFCTDCLLWHPAAVEAYLGAVTRGCARSEEGAEATSAGAAAVGEGASGAPRATSAGALKAPDKAAGILCAGGSGGASWRSSGSVRGTLRTGFGVCSGCPAPGQRLRAMAAARESRCRLVPFQGSVLRMLLC